ncbi:MAG: ATP-dependent DNA ligase [Acidobacteriaceae bacterium]
MAEFEEFAALCAQLAGTSKKLEKRARMAEYLRALPVDDAARAALYLAGTAFSETDPRELNVGGATVSKVLKAITGADDHQMHAAYLRHGDLGSAAFDLLRDRPRSKRDAPESSLQLQEVGNAFAGLAAARGATSKQKLLHTLLQDATPLGAKYLIKLMTGDMRIGVKQAQVEEAIGVAYERPLAAVRRAVMLGGDLAEVVRMAEQDRLDEVRMRLFHPLGFMLASPVDTVEEAMTRFAEEVAAERRGEGGAEAPLSDEVDTAGTKTVPMGVVEAHVQDKYDGIRCQLHCGDPGQPGRVALFSRSRDDMTHSFPEIVEAFAEVQRPLILDGEILAWDSVEARALPFASLQNRIGRKRVTAEMRTRTPVVFMAFDLLYRDDALLLEQPLSTRRRMLEEVVAKEAESTRVSGSRVATPPQAQVQVALFEGSAVAKEAMQDGEAFARLVLAPVERLHSAEQLDRAYADARARGNEGVMLKSAASVYQPGRRGLAWLKLKRELATLDVVVTSAEYGHGRRAGTLSDYTFAVRDGDQLKNVGKAYSGLTDAEVDYLSTYFHEHTVEDFGGWRTVEPRMVLEVAFNNLMRSDRHASGFAMRFPRILRIREDKPVEEIDTLARVEAIYNSQPDRPAESRTTEASSTASHPSEA